MLRVYAYDCDVYMLQTRPQPKAPCWHHQRLRPHRQVAVHALHIDRRQHMELAWRRQQVQLHLHLNAALIIALQQGSPSCLFLSWPQLQVLHGLHPLCHAAMQLEEVRLKSEDDSCCSVDCVTELRSLRHLERVIDSDASSIVVVAFYSRVRRMHRHPRACSAGARACVMAGCKCAANMCRLHSSSPSMHAVHGPIPLLF